MIYLDDIAYFIVKYGINESIVYFHSTKITALQIMHSLH